MLTKLHKSGIFLMEKKIQNNTAEFYHEGDFAKVAWHNLNLLESA